MCPWPPLCKANCSQLAWSFEKANWTVGWPLALALLSGSVSRTRIELQTGQGIEGRVQLVRAWHIKESFNLLRQY